MTTRGPAPTEPETLAVAGALPEADRRDEVDAIHERPRRLTQHDDHLAARGGDLGSASRTGEPHLGMTVVVADHSGVDIGVAVDLGSTEEADVDPSRLQPVVEDLGNAHHCVRGLGEDAVADRQRQAIRLGAEGARTRR